MKVVGEANSGSVSLPDDVPLSALVGDLARRYAPGAYPDPVLDAGAGALDLGVALSAAGVADGAELRLSRAARPPEPAGDESSAGEAGVAELGVSVVGSGGVRVPARVPADAPMRAVVARLGEALGIEAVADVRLGDGTLVPPDKSLAALGVRTGSTLFVRALGDPAPSPLPPNGEQRRLTRRGWLAVGLAAALVAGAGVLVGRASAPGSAPTTPLRSLGTAWVAAAPYRGPTWPGVGRALGRSGRLDVALEPAGSWRSRDSSGRTWIVSAPGGKLWGLEAVAFGGRLGYDPTPSGLPFVTGQAPPAAGRVLAQHGPAPAALADWAAKVWGPHGTLTAVVGLGAVGAPQVLVAYRPAGGGTVWRVQLALSSTAPGAPLGAARAKLRTASAKVTADERGVTSAQQAVSAAQAALGAAGKAKPANPGAVSAAQAALATAQRQARSAQAALGADRAALASARAAVARLGVVKAAGVYDLWVRGGHLVGWAPAGYPGRQIGGGR